MPEGRSPRTTLGLVVASILGMLISGVLLQWDVVLMGSGSFAGEISIPFPPIVVLIALVLVIALAWRLMRVRLLTRAQVLCVLYAMLIAMPLMTQGFWHRFASITSTLPQEPQTFAVLDAYPAQLWPHGPNLGESVLDPEAVEFERLATLGTVELQPLRVKEKGQQPGAVLENDAAGEVSSVRLRLPMQDEEGNQVVTPGEPYLASVLVRPGEAPNYSLEREASEFFMRLYIDGKEDDFIEVFTSSRSGEITFLQPEAFVRMGSQNLRIPPRAQQSVTLEVGLRGEGTLSLSDLQLMNVSAMAQLTEGRRYLPRSEWEALPPELRADASPRPDRLMSLAGLEFLLTAYVPWKQWAAPLVAWGTFLLLLLTVTLLLNVLLRKQWIDGERYGLPLTRIPMSLMGGDDLASSSQEVRERPGFSIPPVYRMWTAWIGFAFAILYTLSRAYHFYNPQFPDVSISVPLSPYFQGPGVSRMFAGVTFSLSLVFLSIAIFMELSVLLSIVIGFFLFKSLGWIGQVFGFGQLAGYPWQSQQQTGSYVVYAFLIVLLARRHIWRLLKASFTGDREEWKGELMPYPLAIGGIALCGVLALLWAAWVGVSLSGMAVFFVFLVLIALVAARIRCEAGVPFSYLGINNAGVVLAAFGGLAAFGPEAMLFAAVASFMVGPTPFFMLPGAQMELVALGKRVGLRARHVALVTVIGVVGGIVIGGWVFLGGGYGVGGDEMNYEWAFSDKAWYFTEFKQQVQTATAEMRTGETEADSFDPSIYGYVIGGGAMSVVAVIRQFVPGFWFHPLGVLLGPNWLSTLIWGSCLVAWVIRLAVLKLGGAMMVRNRLQPLFVGVFVGAVMGHLIHLLFATLFLAPEGQPYFSWGLYNLP